MSKAERYGEMAGGHKGSCVTCPFNAGFTAEGAQAENYGCLPTAMEIVEMKRESGHNLACHDDEGRVCAGLCAVAKEQRIDLSQGGLIRYTTWYQRRARSGIEPGRRHFAFVEGESILSGIITHARITAMPVQLGDEMPIVKVRIDGGAEVDLLTYYPDEISFVATEFIGMTTEAAKQLQLQKDVAYLQS